MRRGSIADAETVVYTELSAYDMRSACSEPPVLRRNSIGCVLTDSLRPRRTGISPPKRVVARTVGAADRSGLENSVCRHLW